MGKKEASKALAPSQPHQPRCNIDAPDASSDSEQLLAWACYGMMAAARAWDVGCIQEETVAFECIQDGEREFYTRLDSCDADDNTITLQFAQMNCCRPGSEADIPCVQLLEECGATPLNAHQLLYVPPCTLCLSLTLFRSHSAELPGLNVAVSCEISEGSSIGSRLYVSFVASDVKSRPVKRSRFGPASATEGTFVQPKFNASCSSIDVPADSWGLLSSTCTWNNKGVYCIGGAPANSEALSLPSIHGADGP